MPCCLAVGMFAVPAGWALCWEASSPDASPRYSTRFPKPTGWMGRWTTSPSPIATMAGYTFGLLSTPGNGSSDAVLPIIECHSKHACVGGETSFQCFLGYADARCAWTHVPNSSQPTRPEPSLRTV